MPKTASLEIHQINAGQGDATLVLVRDTAKLRAAVITAKSQTIADGMEPIDYLPYCVKEKISLLGTVKQSLLIDGGNDCYGFAVRTYCESVGALDTSKVSQTNFLMMVTHYHDDHQDGLRCVMRDPDPSGGKPVEKYRPRQFYRLAPFKKRDGAIGVTGAIVDEIANQVVATTGTDRLAKTEILYVPKGGKNDATTTSAATQWGFELGKGVGGMPVNIRVVASERAVFAGTTNAIAEVPPKKRKGRKKSTVDENDRSIAVVVEYGSFRHFVAADTGGAEGSAYADIEGVLAPQMALTLPIARAANAAKFASAGHCCSFKLNHHGTKFSNDARFFATLRPRLAIVPAGVKLYFHGHPTKETVARMVATNWLASDGTTQVANTLAEIVATEIASKGKGKTFNPDPTNKIKIMGDMIIRPIDEDLVAAHLATAAGQAVRIQVYGNREQTPLPTGSKCALRATVAAATTGNYPVTPLELSCGLH